MTCGIEPDRDGDCWDEACEEHNPETAAELRRQDAGRILRFERDYREALERLWRETGGEA